MRNSLVITTEASYSMNFLIYLRNIFLNQQKDDQDDQFPYFPSFQPLFVDNFEGSFKKLWDDIGQKLADTPRIDAKVFHDSKKMFYEELFVKSEDSLTNPHEIHRTFDVWARSFAGRYAIERSIDEERIYKDLVRGVLQQGITPQKTLRISVVYDRFPQGLLDSSSYFVLLPIEDFLGKYEAVIAKLLSCIDE